MADSPIYDRVHPPSNEAIAEQEARWELEATLQYDASIGVATDQQLIKILRHNRAEEVAHARLLRMWLDKGALEVAHEGMLQSREGGGV